MKKKICNYSPYGFILQILIILTAVFILFASAGAANCNNEFELRYEVGSAQPGAVITIDSDFRVLDEIVIDKSLTIDLNMHTISGYDYSRIFKVNKNVDFILKNGRINDGYAEKGAGIYSDGGNVRLEGVAIQGCKADGNFGSPDYQGGGVYVRDGGSLTMINSIIIDCLSDDWGGGVYLDWSSCTMEKSIIQECTSNDYEGGGMFLKNSKLTMNNSTIQKCIAEDFHEGRGGGIYADDSTITMIYSIINECKTDDNNEGGGMYLSKSTLTINNSIIQNCECSDSGAGMYLSKSTLTINNSIIQKCKGSRGGGISCDYSTVHMTNCHINDCTSSGYGGGIYVNMDSVLIMDEGSTITACSAINHGGGVYVGSNSTFEMMKSKISDIDAGGGGGVYNYDGVFKMTESVIQNCKADGDGGGVRSCGETSIINSRILNCKAKSLGGGICIAENTVTMDNTIIADCTAKQGGGVYIEDVAKFIMNSGVIKNCKATDDGGGVFNDFGMSFVVPKFGEFTMNGGSIIDCSADDMGTALYDDQRCDFNFAHGILNKWDSLYGLIEAGGPDKIGQEPTKKVKLIYGDKEYYQYWRCDDTYLDSCPFTAPEGTIFLGWAKSKDGPVVYKDKEKFNFDTDTLYPVFYNIVESVKYDHSPFTPVVVEKPEWWMKIFLSQG